MPRYTTLAAATIVGVAALTLAEAQGRSSMIQQERPAAPRGASSVQSAAPEVEALPPDPAAATKAVRSPNGRVAVRTISASVANRRLQASRSCDLDGDGRIDGADLALVRAAIGTRQAAADVTGDSLVDERDLAAILAAWSR